MIGRSETAIKWALFAAATLVCLLAQGFVLQYITVLGVMPFLYPVLPALVGMYEGALPGTVYGLILGVACDLTIPGAIPCLYTLAFPAAGLCAGLIAKSWLPAGVLCALAASTVSFALTDALRCLVLAFSGQASWLAGLVAAKETALTLPFVLPACLLFRQVHRKCHFYD